MNPRASAAPEAAPAAAPRPPLRLLFVTALPALGSGSNHQLLSLAGELVRRGHAVTVAAPLARQPVPPELELTRFEASGCRLVRFPVMAKRPRLGTLRGVRRLVRAGAFDVLHATMGRALDHLYLATLAMPACPPLVVTRPMQYPLDLFNSIKYRSRRVRRIIAVSGFVKSVVVRTGRVRPEKVEVIHDSDDFLRFDPDTMTGASVRAEFGIPETAPLVGIVANLGAYKRYDLFVETAAHVLHQVPEAYFLSAGQGDAEPYRARARELGIAERIVFAGYRADVPRLLAAMDLTVNTSWNEALGSSRLESLAMRVPAVSFDGGGSPEVIRDGVTGYLAPFPNTRALAARIVELLRDPARRRAMGRAGREDVLARFALAIKADAHERIYHELASCASIAGSSAT